MIGTSREPQSGVGGDGDRDAVRLAVVALYCLLAVSIAGGVIWLLPAATPEPARNGVGVATAVMLAYPLVKKFSDRGFAIQVVAAVAAGGITAVVSWGLLLFLGG